LKDFYNPSLLIINEENAMKLEQRIENLPYGTSKNGAEFGFNVLEENDLCIYLHPFRDDLSREKTKSAIKEQFPEASEVDYLEDGSDSPFWVVRIPDGQIKIEVKGDE